VRLQIQAQRGWNSRALKTLGCQGPARHAVVTVLGVYLSQKTPTQSNTSFRALVEAVHGS
jgi:hypothetical protein